MQRNWIGRSKGVSVNFKVKGLEKNIEVFIKSKDQIIKLIKKKQFNNASHISAFFYYLEKV